jgi:hypothetical protein
VNRSAEVMGSVLPDFCAVDLLGLSRRQRARSWNGSGLLVRIACGPRGVDDQRDSGRFPDSDRPNRKHRADRVRHNVVCRGGRAVG